MKKFISCAMVGVLILAAGCTGPFALTKKVHAWQTSFDDKWVDEVAFLGCVILPVYSLSALADAVILNSVEFWTGDNPMDASLSKDGESVKITHQDNGTILIESDAGVCVLEKSDAGVCAMDAEGNVLYTAKTGVDNMVRVYNAEGEVVRTFSKS